MFHKIIVKKCMKVIIVICTQLCPFNASARPVSDNLRLNQDSVSTCGSRVLSYFGVLEIKEMTFRLPPITSVSHQKRL